MTTSAPRPSGPGSLPVIALQGEFDYASVPGLQARIDTAVNTHGGLILDAGAVTFVDSTVVTLILMTHQRTHLRIAGLSPHLEHLFGIYGIDQVLHIYPTADAAQTA
ncbi:STAS domain-containing protein [uncultured Streptomyces sp.]|uniref:STAS domain-containing protein n=1 Tax=uncultured Streptomyces sp. TaxID=174707 RepID=UPI002633354A|nr:STAS domain-containing protein [uncultured Streptomyces sp.]